MNKPTRYIIVLLIIIGMLVFGAEVFGQVILNMHEGDMIAVGDYRLCSFVSTVTH